MSPSEVYWIQSKFRFPTLLVLPVTGIAFAGEQGAYFTVEVYFSRCRKK
jgi:hypothetical protein